MIPLFKPSISEKGLREVRSVLKSGIWAVSWGGPKVKELEEKFAEYIGCEGAVAVNSGTAALYLAIRTLPRDADGEVLLPSLTFIATAHAVVEGGLRPVFVDVEEDTLNIDMEDLKAKITSKTKGIIPVHFAGRSCRIREISEIAEDHGLWVMDDASHACGSTYDGKKIGSFFDRTVFSLHPVKPLASLGGGIITFNERNPYLKERLEAMRFCGVTARRGPLYDVQSIGWNYYMTEPSAAVALDGLERLDVENQKRRRIARLYNESFEGLKRVETLPFDERSTYHLYVLKVKSREKFMKHMANNGIETGIHYAMGCHEHRCYRNNKTRLPVTESVTKQLVSIPVYSSLQDDEIKQIVDTVQSWNSIH
ncbi:MAG: DegT/DnrJ/EryC1/StrS family aminotransferase [Dehalococcoidia bacterium]|nr:MAG: DegT/DnrJ/EryC1/StrS family aminotransferase [Dehalococcoidia bacterium]